MLKGLSLALRCALTRPKPRIIPGVFLHKMNFAFIGSAEGLILQAAYPLSDAAFIMTEIKSGISRKEFKRVMIF